jgi:hypothetical protein
MKLDTERTDDEPKLPEEARLFALNLAASRSVYAPALPSQEEIINDAARYAAFLLRGPDTGGRYRLRALQAAAHTMSGSATAEKIVERAAMFLLFMMGES